MLLNDFELLRRRKKNGVRKELDPEVCHIESLTRVNTHLQPGLDGQLMLQCHVLQQQMCLHV